jgi:hypothetical protein
MRARQLRRLHVEDIVLMRRLLALAGLERGVLVAGYRVDYAGKLGGRRPPVVIANDWLLAAEEWERRKSAWEASGFKVLSFTELAG